MATTFTPEQIAQILEEFFKVVGTRQYVGARYVPIFGRKGEDSIEWDNTGTYEPLTIVLYQGNSYTSRQYVPVGVEITNQEFWALTGNYNAQVEQYRRETAAAKATADAAQESADAAQLGVDAIDALLPKSAFSDVTVKEYIDDADTALKRLIDGNVIIATKVAYNESGTNSYCYILKSHNDKVLMIDTGYPTSYDYIKSELETNNIEHLDYVLISHYHEDHCGNFESLVQDGFIDASTKAYLSRKPINPISVAAYNEQYATSIIQRVTEVCESVTYPSNGDAVNLDDVQVTFYNCSVSDTIYYDANSSDYNDYSIICYVTCGESVFGFFGDIGMQAQTRCFVQGYAKKVNVASLPHHAVDETFYFDFADKIQPKYALAAATEYLVPTRLSIKSAYVDYCTAIGCPVYLQGYSSSYICFDKGNMLVGNDGEHITGACDRTNYLVYVDYVNGRTSGDGSTQQPFKSIMQAVGYINRYRDISIEIHVSNSDGSEAIYITENQNRLLIFDANLYSATVRNCACVEFRRCTFSGVVDVQLTVSNSIVNLEVCTFNTNALDSSVAGRAISASNSSLVNCLGNTTIIGAKIGLFVGNNSNAYVANVTGSGNYLAQVSGNSTARIQVSSFVASVSDVQPNSNGIVSGAVDYGYVAYKVFEYDNLDVPANGNASQEIDATLANYTPIGALECYSDNATDAGTNASSCFVWRCGVSPTNPNRLYLGVHNTAQSAAKIKIHVTVLYKRS